MIGVKRHYELLSAGSNVFEWQNRRAHIPLTTAWQLFGEPGALDSFEVKVRDATRLPEVADQLENTLLAMHRGIHDFSIETRLSEMEALNEKEANFTYSLGSLAMMTLLVGGIGIANVMLASLNERIREIGVRKAVGARSTDIFMQFLVESILISLIGGLLGILVGYGFVELIRFTLTDETVRIVLHPQFFLIGFVFSAGTGILSGIYPALKAAKLHAIDALRYE